MIAPHGGEGRGLDLEPEARGKPDAAQQPQMIFAEARVRVADGADDAARQIAAPSTKSSTLAGVRVHHQAVDGEIAAQHVFAGIVLEAHVFGMPAVQVIVIAAEGGDLHLVEDVAHQHHAEVRAHAAGAREEIHDAVGAGIGGDVEVLGLDAEEQVADAAADQVCLVAPGAQPGDHLVCERFRIHLPMLI